MKHLQLLALNLSLAISTAFCYADVNVEKLANDDWLLVTSPNFEIITDLNEKEGKGLVEDLENYRYFSTEIMHRSVIPKARPLKILAVSSSFNFKRLGLPENWAGVFHMNELGYNAITNAGDYRTGLQSRSYGRQVLFHEYNHFLVRFAESTTIFPMWYDEGSAEYFGTFRFDGKKFYLGDPKVIESRVDGLYKHSGQFSLDIRELLKTTELPLRSNREADRQLASDFYGKAFFLVHYLNSSAELRDQLDRYLNLIGRGYTIDKAFELSFATTYTEMEKRVEKYINQSLAMRVISLKDGNITLPKHNITVQKLDEAGFYRETYDVLLSHEGQTRENAKKILDNTAALNPNLIDVKISRLMKGFSEDFAKDLQSLQQNENQTPFSLYYVGWLTFRQAEMMRLAGQNDWETPMKVARSLFRRAIKLDATAQYAYGALGDVYKYLPDTEPLQEGEVCLDTAVIHRRDDKTFGDLAHILIRMKKGIELLPAVRNAVAFAPNPDDTNWTLLLDNLEIFKDTSYNQGEPTETGLIYKSGGVYTGPVVDGKPNGKGTFIRPNGARLEGDFVNGVIQGRGKLVSPNTEIYEGTFKDGIAKGNAKITYTNGTYEGDVEYMLPHGKGVLTTSLGRLDAQFVHGDAHGAGVFKPTASADVLKGNWILDQYQWPAIENERFIGSIDQNGQRSGRGVCENIKTKQVELCLYKNGKRSKAGTEE